MSFNYNLTECGFKILISFILLALIATITGCSTGKASSAPLPPEQRLRVATTTSLYDTGLWGYLEPMFEDEYDVEVDVLYAGTGIALEYGKRGDVDVITVHSKSREEQFIAAGYGVERVPFAYNYFLIVGPTSDPAGIKGMNPEDAFKQLLESGTVNFISRGDDSGTHDKEKAIWGAAGFEHATVREAGSWYIEAGRGMGPTLLMANENQGYTLTDIGTFLSFKGQVQLVPIVNNGNILLNVYSAIASNTKKTPKVKYEMADNMVNFLISPDIQELIGKYGAGEYSMQLFTPCADSCPN